LRAEGLAVRAELGERKLSRQLEVAARDGAHFAAILGEDTAATQIQLRDLHSGTQRAVNVADLARELRRADAAHQHGTPAEAAASDGLPGATDGTATG
jgi:histidyl-tRNA synthetase